MLTTNNTLQYLNLYSCSISDIGVQHLSEAVQHNNTISELYLSLNKAITDTGAVALSDLMKVNKSLRTLHLLGTSVGEEGAAALIESLRHNEVVTELWLSDELEECCRSHSVFDKVENQIEFSLSIK